MNDAPRTTTRIPLEDDFDDDLLTEEERDRSGDFGTCIGPKYPDPREVAEVRASVEILLRALDNRCPKCDAAAAYPSESAFEAECDACGQKSTKYALAGAVLADVVALKRLLEPYDGLWELLAEEGRLFQ